MFNLQSRVTSITYKKLSTFGYFTNRGRAFFILLLEGVLQESFQIGFVHGANYFRFYNTIGIDDEGHGDCLNIICSGNFSLIAIANRECIAPAGNKLSWSLLLAIQANGYKINSVLILLVFGLNMGELLHAGRTPGGPKVQIYLVGGKASMVCLLPNQ